MREDLLGKIPRKLFIGGEWLAAASGATFACIDPSNGQHIVDVARAGPEDIDAAVRAARSAFQGEWAGWKPLDRQSLLLRVAEAIDRRFDDLAAVESHDMGAPIAKTSLYRRWIRQVFQHYAAMATTTRGDIFTNSVPGDFLSYSLKVPVGVVGAIIPWNGPLLSQFWSICPTLATGCTLVLKPAEEAPMSCLMIADILSEAGVPPGVINVVPGPGATAGAALAAHTDVDKITFTGSTATGRSIIQASTSNIKRVSLELGGKSPNIVFADADLDVAARSAALACFNNTGQICFAGTRLLVERSCYEDFVQRVAAVTRSLRIGSATDPATEIGPLASRAQFDRVNAYLDIAEQEGARFLEGGDFASADPANGFFVKPVVLADVHNDMRIAQEEVFGPVLAAIPFDDEEQAITLANSIDYGLGGGVWSRDVGRVHRVTRALRSGMTWANCYGVMDPGVTFTGAKMSGYGVKGGPWHTEEYLLAKTVWLNIA